MPVSFRHTLRSLDEREARLPWLVVTLVVLGAWAWWMTKSSVTIYVTSRVARLETAQRVHRVAPVVGGRLAHWELQLGQPVRRGQVLAILDGSVEEARLTEEKLSLQALKSKAESIEKQLSAEQLAQSSRTRVDAMTAIHADVRLRQSRARAEHQQGLNQIAQGLREEGLNTAVDALTANSSLRAAQLEVDEARVESARLRAQRELDGRVASVGLARLRRELDEVTAESAIKAAAIEAATSQLELLKVRAFADGKIGSVSPAREGDVVDSGEVLATIVPEGEVRLVAEFSPAESAGRVLPGQRAQVRFDGFSWTQYGLLEAKVTQSGVEPQQGVNRVELVLESDASRIPLQHGLTARVDVQVEQRTPWELVLQTMGGRLVAQDSSQGSPADSVSEVAR